MIDLKKVSTMAKALFSPSTCASLQPHSSGCSFLPLVSQGTPHQSISLQLSPPRWKDKIFESIQVSESNKHSTVETENTELEAISCFSAIVPDTVIFDDLERLAPTAATVSSSLLLGILSLPKSKFSSAVELAMEYEKCILKNNPDERVSCFLDKAYANVGAELVKLVRGHVSNEVDARLAYDTQGILKKARVLSGLYEDVGVSKSRVLFKIPATWQGIEAARHLESEGIQTHVTFVYSFPQAAAAAQAGVSIIQIFVGRIRDWARNHSGDSEIEAAVRKGEDPGVALVTKAYHYIHKLGMKTKVMAAAVRNKQDVFSLLGVDYVIVPVRVLQSLQDSKTPLEDKYSFFRRLSPNAADTFPFLDGDLVKWDQKKFAEALGPAPEEMLSRGLDGYINNTKRIEEYISKVEMKVEAFYKRLAKNDEASI